MECLVKSNNLYYIVMYANKGRQFLFLSDCTVNLLILLNIFILLLIESCESFLYIYFFLLSHKYLDRFFQLEIVFSLSFLHFVKMSFVLRHSKKELLILHQLLWSSKFWTLRPRSKQNLMSNHKMRTKVSGKVAQMFRRHSSREICAIVGHENSYRLILYSSSLLAKHFSIASKYRQRTAD